MEFKITKEEFIIIVIHGDIIDDIFEFPSTIDNNQI